MSNTKVHPLRNENQDPISVTADVRLAETGKVKAFADVVISFGSFGTVAINGFSIFHGEGQKPRCAPPARVGKKRYFDIVGLTGEIRERVEQAVLWQYERQVTRE